MTLGYQHDEHDPHVVSRNDTATLFAVLYGADESPLTADDLAAVSFEVARPDNTRAVLQGTIQDDGSGQGRFDDTSQIGLHAVVATFTLADGVLRSTRADFEVVDPFLSETPSPSYVVAASAWAKIEDCFDSESDGPWLQEMTRAYFKKERMESFIDEALFFINNANPPTTLAVTSFVGDANPPVITADLPLLAQGVFLCVLRHLIRSYVEQPEVVGIQAGWHSRRDYLTRWQSVLQIEQAAFDRMLALYKRRFLGLGQTAGLVTSKAGRLVSAPMRTRYVGRGYW